MIDESSSCNPTMVGSGGRQAHADWLVIPPKSGAPLGIVTKTTSTLTPQGLRDSFVATYDTSTGEIKPVEVSHYDVIGLPQFRNSYDSSQGRNKRFALKSVVNEIMPGSRTSTCMRFRAPDPCSGGLRPIEILKSAEHGKAFYQGLMACGRVWHCPVCAAKISERRRIELKGAMASAERLGLKAHFITLTIPHGIGDDIQELLDKLRLANKKMSSGRNAVKKRLQELLGEDSDATVGFIRALEVTHGKNGFHPHFHIILFTHADVTTSLVKYVYSKAWIKACLAADLPEPHIEHGCVVKDGSYASEYVSKWGIEDEMTKANTKITKQKGRSPWGLLDAMLTGDDEFYTPEKSRSLFMVYAKAFSGQRQLYWSNGLRKALYVEKEETDEEIVSRPDDVNSYLLAQIPFKDWKRVLKAKQEANLLTVAESNPLAIQLFIDNLPRCDSAEDETEDDKEERRGFT